MTARGNKSALIASTEGRAATRGSHCSTAGGTVNVTAGGAVAYNSPVGFVGARRIPVDRAAHLADDDVRFGIAGIDLQRALGGRSRDLQRRPRRLAVILGE